MWFLVDLCVLAIIGLCIFFGYKKGLIGVAFKIVSFVLAIIIAFILFNPISNFIVNNTTLDDKIESMVVEKVKIENEIISETEDVEGYVQTSLKNVAIDTANDAVKSVARQITITIVNIIVFLIVFVLAKVILLLTKGVLNFISGLPIIKQFNKTGGIIYGFVKGLLIVYLIFAIISLIAISNTSEIIILINQSILGKILYNNNLLLSIFFNAK